MFQLLTPISLLAASAVIIPILIHLWNTRKGKTLKVGSIALLKETSRKPARSFQISNWPLLLLRCLLFILAAILLSKPIWQDRASNNQSGWMLVAPHQLAEAYKDNRTLIDSMLPNGYELRNLYNIKEKLALEDTNNYRAADITGNEITWSYLKYVDAAVPADFPIYVFAEQSLQHFAGERPSVQLKLNWISLNCKTKTDTIVVDLYKDNKGHYISTNLISSAYGNYYEDIVNNSSVSRDTSGSINIAIYAAGNDADAKYIMAAVDAISAYTGRDIVINKAGVLNKVIFWLQDNAPDTAVLSTLAAGGTLFRYDHTNIASMQVNAPSGRGMALLDGARPDQFYQYATGPLQGKALWTLSNGEPLLSLQSSGDKNTIYFRSRFNPQWTDMVWKESLSRFLLPIILPSFEGNKIDLREISKEQALPAIANRKVNGTVGEGNFIHEKDLSFLLWLAIFFVFIAERLLVYRTTSRKNG